MIIKTAEFLISNTKQDRLPEPTMPEFAFIGRSNVGKSSLINMLCRKKGLAKTSQSPGKTQVINHFVINSDWFLVDLPGYGYAKVSQTTRKSWEGMIKTYLETRENLQCVMALVDSRLEPQKVDLEFIDWLGGKGIPFCIIFTKADKQSKAKTAANVDLFNETLLKNWEELPTFFITSAEEGTGKEDVLEYIDQINKNYIPFDEQ
ncbi:MAG: ribosome biogenesis GTP-binding protein YihA/YsxC [Sphingobacteriales bacterium]|jgi:GTP-binding protein|nr:ribosome biogenesis GTP-binding protein YihA/YsxC [Sphingobacteriales bacterium]